MFVGIPATGKSSFYLDRFAATHLRINRDMLKTPARTYSLFEWCLLKGQSCVLDNTNSTRARRSEWIEAATSAGVPVVMYFFQSELKGALDRNSRRTGKARIPDTGVLDHHSSLELPEKGEGFSEMYFVRLVSDRFEVEDWNHEI